jgi:hypothetical protein
MGFSDEGYSFIFIISGEQTLYFTKLLIQILLAGLLSVIVYYTYPLIQNIALKLLIATVLIFLSISIIYIWYNHSDLLLNMFLPNEERVINLKEKVEQDIKLELLYLEKKLDMRDLYSIGKSLLNDESQVWIALPLPDSGMPNIDNYLVDFSKEELREIDSLSRIQKKGKSFHWGLIDWNLVDLEELIGYDYDPPNGKTIDRKKFEEDFLKSKKKYYRKVFKDLFEYVKLKEQYDNDLKEIQGMKDPVRIYGAIILAFILFIIMTYKRFRIVKTIENKLLKSRT